GRLVLDQNPVGGNTHADRDVRELVGLGLAPQVLRDRSQSAREDQERRPAVEEQLRTALGDGFVVAAQDQDRVRLYERVVHVVVVPELLGELVDARVHPRQPTRITSSVRGPWTPLMRVISMSAVADGPEIVVATDGLSARSRRIASGTV